MSLQRLNIYLIRHGESEANLNLDLYQNQHDATIKLTDKGIKQAIETGQFLNEQMRLQSNGSYRFYSSCYDRAIETMDTIISQLDPVNRPMPQDIKHDIRIRECEFGDADGISDENLKITHPEFYKKMIRDEKDGAKYFTRYPRGESPADVGLRCRLFLDALVRDYEKHRIRNYVIVSHGIVLRAFMKELLHSGDFRWYANQKNPKNASVYQISNNKAAIGLNIPEHEGCIFIPELSK